MKKLKQGLLGFLGFFVVLFLWASFPWDLNPRQTEDLIDTSPATGSELERPTTLKILSWNIAYAYGMDSDGTAGYQPMSEEKFRANLGFIAETIQRAEADVVLLQEIDFDASRSRHLDQLRLLAEKSGLRHWARAESWRTNYVAFPSWPPARHFGSMSSGGAVLSRWPIKKNSVDLLSKPAANAWWYNLFYLHRYFQTVDILVGGRTLRFINLHLEAFDQPTRTQQARFLLGRVKELNPDFVGGDFNMLPDGAMKRSAFSDPTTSYENDPTFSVVTKLGYKEVVDLGSYLRQEDLWFTFPSVRPDRRLDYLFYRPDWTLIKSEVFAGLHPEVSDHLPVRATFKFFDPVFIRD